MKIGIANDHRGKILKDNIKIYLEEKGYEVINYGSNEEISVDFPKYAKILANEVINKNIDLGIAICYSGIGMSIACNKIKGIMCAKINNQEDAKLAKEHNNANILALPSNIEKEEILKMLEIFLNTKFNQDYKYQNRINQIKELENL